MATKKTTTAKPKVVKPTRVKAEYNQRIGNSITHHEVLLDEFPNGELRTLDGQLYIPNGAETFTEVK